MTDLKESLLTGRLPKDTVTFPGVGLLTVRGLTRIEAGQVNQRDDSDARDRLILHLGLVEPELTEAEAGQLMTIGLAGDVTELVKTIAQLSGLLEASPGETFPSVRD